MRQVSIFVNLQKQVAINLKVFAAFFVLRNLSAVWFNSTLYCLDIQGSWRVTFMFVRQTCNSESKLKDNVLFLFSSSFLII
ncbi:hypothetical protein BH24ACI2_BH24ACI2_05160 [soil metagenome]